MSEKVRVIDIGGAGARRADVTDGGELVVVESTPASVSDLLSFVKQDMPSDCSGVVYVTAGLIENHDLIIKAPNVPWLNRVHLATETFHEVNKQAFVFNDMDGACLGMRKLIPQLKNRRFIGVTISSGVGARIVQADGSLAFERGEIGHFCIDSSRFAPHCACGARGCVESIIGGRSLEQRVREVARRILPDGIHPMKFLDAQYLEDAPWAKEIYRDFAEGLARFMATLIVITDCTEFVFKGTVANAMIPRIYNLCDMLAEKMPIDPTWAYNVFIRYSPPLYGQKNTDSFLGGYELFKQMSR